MTSSSLISLSAPDRCLDRRLMEASGGFLWWYVDLVDERGDGVVLIWSFGLPFLPGYADAARRGTPQKPSDRPSLNLSVYKDGRLAFYLLQEYAPREARWSECGAKWQFGESRIEARQEDGHLHLRAELDCPVRGSSAPLRGRIDLHGVCRRPNGRDRPDDAPPHHDWTPRVGPAQGLADLSHAGRRWHIEGRAYHDRNGGASPLHDLGIAHWLWGRVPLEGRELIYYLLWDEDAPEPVCLGLTIDQHGHTDVVDLDVELGDQRTNLGGLTWWETIDLRHDDQPWLLVRHTDVVDNGPFYMRYLTEVEPGGVRGVGELCQPDRVDLARHRPLVRMRVHQTHAANSIWLPLFTGPKQGRLRRLLGSWLPGGSP